MNVKISGVVYCYTSPSGKKYVGQTIRESRRRCDHRLAPSNNPFHKAVRKYGYENMAYEVLFSNVETIEELNELEEQAIKEHNCLVPHGYNLDSGGKNKFKHPETREKIRQKAYGRKISEETRQKLRDSHKGQKPSKTTVEKVRKALTGLDRGPEFKAKMKEVRNRPEMKEAVRKAHTGRKHTPEALANIRGGHFRQKVLCIETGKVYNSIKEASEDTGVNTNSISRGARGIANTVKYRWKYVS